MKCDKCKEVFTEKLEKCNKCGEFIIYYQLSKDYKISEILTMSEIIDGIKNNKYSSEYYINVYGKNEWKPIYDIKNIEKIINIKNELDYNYSIGNFGISEYLSKFINRFVFYNIAMVFPIIALIMTTVLDYKKEKDNFLDRIKLISLYELFISFILILFYSIFGLQNIIFTIVGILLFFAIFCGIKANNKLDYFSRGFFIGLFSCHFGLSVISTSNYSTARINDQYWPDSGLCVFLMINRLIYLIPYYFIYKYIQNILSLIGT